MQSCRLLALYSVFICSTSLAEASGRVRLHLSSLYKQSYQANRLRVVDIVPSFAGFEARGLIFGAPLALALNCAFVPLRKPGKLPGETIQESYVLEYGSDKIEMHVGHIKEGQRVLLLDDLIATGGTMGAGIKLMSTSHHLRSSVIRDVFAALQAVHSLAVAVNASGLCRSRMRTGSTLQTIATENTCYNRFLPYLAQTMIDIYCVL